MGYWPPFALSAAQQRGRQVPALTVGRPGRGARRVKRKVLMLCDSLGSGGAERQLALLSSSLPAPWEASVFALGGGRYADELRALGVPLTVARRRGRLDPSPTLQLWRVIAAHRPDVVHCWGWMTCWAAAPLCRVLGVPLLAGVIRRGNPPHRRRFLMITASRFGRLALANSQAGLSAFGVPAHRGRVLHNGFAWERMPAEAPRQEHRPPLVVMAATMDERKDHDLFLAVARELVVSRGLAARFVVIGGGRDASRLEREADDLVRCGAVQFTGRVNEVLGIYRSAAVGVLLTTAVHGEGISNSIMEYMASGLPVVCSDNGGNPELVVDGVTGHLVPVGGKAQACEAIARLLADPVLARRLGDAGRARIRDEFSVARMAARAAAIYEECRAGGRR
jgi:glycosyltransferase involved in cell wall biosynthesis